MGNPRNPANSRHTCTFRLPSDLVERLDREAEDRVYRTVARTGGRNLAVTASRARFKLEISDPELARRLAAEVERLQAENTALMGVVDAVRQWGEYTPRRVTKALDQLADAARPTPDTPTPDTPDVLPPPAG